MMGRKPAFFIALFLLLILLGVFLVYGSLSHNTKGIYLHERPREVEPFTLMNQFGHSYDKNNLKGKWHLISLGFTNCPDVCPTTLHNFAKLKEQLSSGARARLQLTFLSVDPQRDSPVVLENYVQFFDPSILALTGEAHQIKQFASQLGGFFMTNSTAGQSGYYSVDHSTDLILLNAEGRYAGFIQADVPLHAQAKLLNRLVID